jgi:DNA repair ATPase RecN
MNKENRKKLEKAISLIDNAKEIVERIKDEEQDKFDNLSEGLQQSDKGEKFEDNVSTLDEVLSQLDEAIDGINTASE